MKYTIGFMLLGVALAFCAVSFFYVSFDIRDWSKDARFFCLLLMALGSSAGFTVGLGFDAHAALNEPKE